MIDYDVVDVKILIHSFLAMSLMDFTNFLTVKFLHASLVGSDFRWYNNDKFLIETRHGIILTTRLCLFSKADRSQ